jgi:hypothetical protein
MFNVRVTLHDSTSLTLVMVSVHGYIAMSLGIVFTLLVGCGLMGLMFYSSRHAYDDAGSDLSDIIKNSDAQGETIRLRCPYWTGIFDTNAP